MATIVVCDVCDARGASSINLPVGTMPDPVEGTVEAFEKFDLCDKCCTKILLWLLRKQLNSYEINEKVVDYVKQKMRCCNRK